MGNHGSRKDQAKWARQGGKAANTLSRVEELRGPPVDSYDKLIAWLAEMAETDNVQLDTSVFVSQLNRVCRGCVQNDVLGVPQTTGFSGTSGGDALFGGTEKRPPNTRQNSTSCDSHVSSDVTQRNKSSTRSDDFLDPSSAWRSGVSTRQNTFSDDLEEEEDADVRNASIESLYSSTDRDSELGSLLAYDDTSRRCGRNWGFQNGSPLPRALLAKRLQCVQRDQMLTPCSASTGDLDFSALTDARGMSCSFNPYVKKSASLLNLSKPGSIVSGDSIPKLVLTNGQVPVHEHRLNLSKPESIVSGDSIPKLVLTNGQVPVHEHRLNLSKPESIVSGDSIPKLVLTNGQVPVHEHRPPIENTFIRKKLGSGPKSLSLTSGRQRQAKFERQFSLHSDPRPSASMTVGGFLPPIFPARIVNVDSPDKATEQAATVFLNDSLLDRNIADILFSVEALWPKK